VLIDGDVLALLPNKLNVAVLLMELVVLFVLLSVLLLLLLILILLLVLWFDILLAGINLNKFLLVPSLTLVNMLLFVIVLLPPLVKFSV
jgi:hypothetical protein